MTLPDLPHLSAAGQAAADAAQRALAEPLLTEFATRLSTVAPVRALWVHGSLAYGDYRHGRSDLDLVAVLPATPNEQLQGRLGFLHRQLAEDEPDAAKLHCTYLPDGELGDAVVAHFTFAQEESTWRPVTAVTRRELLDGGTVLKGEKPGVLLPPVTDDELHAHIRADLRDYWYPITARPDPWHRDVWVDHGPVTAARATATLREGRLITKREAIARLPALGAPPGLAEDIAARRYGVPPVLTPEARAHRAEQARLFTRALIERALG
ncbi:nucleotidyltransferase domain-containing protein [Kitasatospora sp. NA04385]|uniref:nucleotidyltransferase domain-containing protein n=1 Tax=Kitasatospora sp. NA04385 TaxID=2742135 RepID=UPI001590D23B|nr:nucleotidyltransferase domain-containing protein [Kitasatospora sp. NA04385]QKW22843.1 nucleotidyltransferase domain-containing protein [Kitasatospora sp. NA04385]